MRENGTQVEKNYTIVELDYVKSLKGAEFNASSFRLYLNQLLDDAVVIAVNYWQRGYTGELVTE